jgi:hypothetical protein
MHIFTFEPGDGVSYRVLFGRLPSASPFIPHYLIFGFGEQGDALITIVFDTEHVSSDTFDRRWATARHSDTVQTAAYLADAAWCLFCALTGPAPAGLQGWRADWAERLPPAVRS